MIDINAFSSVKKSLHDFNAENFIQYSVNQLLIELGAVLLIRIIITDKWHEITRLSGSRHALKTTPLLAVIEFFGTLSGALNADLIPLSKYPWQRNFCMHANGTTCHINSKSVQARTLSCGRQDITMHVANHAIRIQSDISFLLFTTLKISTTHEVLET